MMSEKKQNRENELIYVFQKNATEQVRIQFGKFMGKPTLDIRIYYLEPGTADNWKPSTRGISTDRKKIGEFLKGLQLAYEQWQKEEESKR